MIETATTSGRRKGAAPIPFGFNTGIAGQFIPLSHGTLDGRWLAPWNCTVVEVGITTFGADYGETRITTQIDGGAVRESTTHTLRAVVDEPTIFRLGTHVNVGHWVTIFLNPTSDGGELVGYARIRRR